MDGPQQQPLSKGGKLWCWEWNIKDQRKHFFLTLEISSFFFFIHKWIEMTFSKPRAPSTALEKGIDSLERGRVGTRRYDSIGDSSQRHQETTSFAPKWVSFLSVKDLKRFIFVTFKPCFIDHFIYTLVTTSGSVKKCSCLSFSNMHRSKVNDLLPWKCFRMQLYE